MTIIPSQVFCANSVNYIVFTSRNIDTYFILGILNSRLLNYVFSKFSTNSNVNGYEVDNLPIAESRHKNPLLRFTRSWKKLCKSNERIPPPTQPRWSGR